MNKNRPGFTLVEFLVVAVLGAVLLGSVYQALLAQERTYRHTGETIRGQDALRTTLGFLEAELREIATQGGALIGGTDIIVATSDSVTVRAPRKIAFICSVHQNERRMNIWSPGALFQTGEGLFIFVDGVESSFRDDQWDHAVVQSIGSENASCAHSPTGVAQQRVTLTEHTLAGVFAGAPVRSYEQLTYGLYQFHNGWGLGRRDSKGLHQLVGGLAPRGQGLVFEYFDAFGTATTDGAAVSSIQITGSTAPRPASGVEPTTLATTIFLRNN